MAKSITIQVVGEVSTITVKFWGNKVIINRAAAYAEELWYELGYGQVKDEAGELVPFASLTTAQKMNVMLEFFYQQTYNAARTYRNRFVAAATAAEQDAQTAAANLDQFE